MTMQEPVTVTVEPTPNPAARKFAVGRTLSHDPFEVARTDADAGRFSDIFAIPGIVSVFVGVDFISLVADDEDVWTEAKPLARAAITSLLQDRTTLLSATPTDQPAAAAETDPVVVRIKELIETHIRPAVANDGGDIVYRSFENGTLKLDLKGACSSCPSSSATLKQGVQNMMQYFIPEVITVEAVSA
jgi:Fe-S cluster biogenesis protein NfuA